MDWPPELRVLNDCARRRRILVRRGPIPGHNFVHAPPVQERVDLSLVQVVSVVESRIKTAVRNQILKRLIATAEPVSRRELEREFGAAATGRAVRTLISSGMIVAHERSYRVR